MRSRRCGSLAGRVRRRASTAPTSSSIEVGDVALVESYASRAGHTSVRAAAGVLRESRTGETEPTTEFDAVYVAIRGSRADAVHELTVPDEEGERLSEALAGGDD